MALVAIGSSAGGVYYFFFLDKPDEQSVLNNEPIVKPAEGEADNLSENEPSQPIDPRTNIPSKTQYVIENGVEVLNEPNGLYVEDVLYKGESVDVFELKQDHTRVTPYLVLEENGDEVANWVKSDQLSDDKPIITDEEQDAFIASLIQGSDDYKPYKEVFHAFTQKLIDNRQCKHEEFIQTDGWMRSLNYPDKAIYFIYCDGLNVENKIYLDVEKKQLLPLVSN